MGAFSEATDILLARRGRIVAQIARVDAALRGIRDAVDLVNSLPDPAVRLPVMVEVLAHSPHEREPVSEGEEG